MDQTKMYEYIDVNSFPHLVTEIKVYLFGIDECIEKFLKDYKGNIDIECILDSDDEKWGMELFGIKILSPNILEGLKSDEYEIIICSKKYEAIVKQMEKTGTKVLWYIREI